MVLTPCLQIRRVPIYGQQQRWSNSYRLPHGVPCGRPHDQGLCVSTFSNTVSSTPRNTATSDVLLQIAVFGEPVAECKTVCKTSNVENGATVKAVLLFLTYEPKYGQKFKATDRTSIHVQGEGPPKSSLLPQATASQPGIIDAGCGENSDFTQPAFYFTAVLNAYQTFRRHTQTITTKLHIVRPAYACPDTEICR